MTLAELFKGRRTTTAPGMVIERKGVMPQDVAARLVWNPGQGQNSIKDPRDALEQNVWVARGIRTIAQKGSSVPWALFGSDGKPNDQAARKLLQCNPIETWGELVQRVLAWQSLSGYGILYYDNPFLYSYEADRVEMTAVGGQVAMRYHQQNGTTKPLILDQVVVCPGFKPFYSLTGVSDLLPAMDAANLEENATRLTNNILVNGGVMAGILTTDQDLPDDEAAQVKAVFEAKYGGIANSGQVGVFGRGLKWTSLGVDPSNFAAMDISNLTRTEIGAALGVPGMFLNDTASVDYANSKSQERILYRETIQPKCDLLAERFTRFLLPMMGLGAYTFRFDWDQVDALGEDKKAQAEVDQIKLNSNVVTINEIRKRDHLDPVPWGDRPLVNAMLVPLGDTGPAPQAAPPADPEPISPQGDDTGKAWALMFGQPKKKQFSGESRKAYWMTFSLKTVPQERKFAREVLGVFRKQGKRVLAAVERHGAKDLAQVDVITKAKTQDWVDVALGDGEDYAEATKSVYFSFGMQAAEDFQAQWGMANKLDPKVFKAWIDKRQVLTSKYLDETTGSDVRGLLSKLSAEGQGVPDMVAAVQGYFDNIAYRAERVARTEVIGTNNYATLEEYKENGGEAKEWLATQDNVTRDPHLEADGQQVPIDETFTVDGEQLEYPGDTAGSPGNVINCRCTWLPVIGAVASSHPLPDSEDNTPMVPMDEPILPNSTPEQQVEPTEAPLPERYAKGMDDLGQALKQEGKEIPQQFRDQADRMARLLGDKAPEVITGGKGTFYSPGTLQVGWDTIKGEQSDAIGRVLVHEMTHAVQSRVMWADAAADPDFAQQIGKQLNVTLRHLRETVFAKAQSEYEWAAAHGLPDGDRGVRGAWSFLGDLWENGSTDSLGWGHSGTYLEKKGMYGFSRQGMEVLAEYVEGQGTALMDGLKQMDELKPLVQALDDILARYGGLT